MCVLELVTLGEAAWPTSFGFFTISKIKEVRSWELTFSYCTWQCTVRSGPMSEAYLLSLFVDVLEAEWVCKMICNNSADCRFPFPIFGTWLFMNMCNQNWICATAVRFHLALHILRTVCLLKREMRWKLVCKLLYLYNENCKVEHFLCKLPHVLFSRRETPTCTGWHRLWSTTVSGLVTLHIWARTWQDQTCGRSSRDVLWPHVRYTPTV